MAELPVDQWPSSRGPAWEMDLCGDGVGRGGSQIQEAHDECPQDGVNEAGALVGAGYFVNGAG